jgi:hypothetical protein
VTDRRLRQLTVWLHVLTSVGWMALAVVLLALLALAASTREQPVAVAATSMAHYLDSVVLAPFANASASTGLMLSMGTAWGLVHHRWVLAKFAITLGQLYLGIFVLSAALDANTEAAASGTAAGAPLLVVGSAAMAGAVAFQGWLSIAKPGGRTRWASGGGGRPVRLPTASRWVFASAVAAPVVDIAVGTVVGFSTPVLSLVMLAAAVVARRRALRALRCAPRERSAPVV